MNSRLRVLVVAPYSLRAARGNSVTLERIVGGLRRSGVRVSVLGSNLGARRGRFDLVHGFHAWRTGPRARQLAAKLGVPYVITLTGTDISRDLAQPRRRRVVREVLRQAAAIVAFSPQNKKALGARLPRLARKVQVIPQGIAGRFFSCRAGEAA